MKYRFYCLVFKLFKLFRPNLQCEINKVLFVTYDAVGDLLVTTPVFSQLKQHNPNLIIDVLVSPRNYRIVENNPNINRYFVTSGKNSLLSKFERALTKELRQQHYDVVIDLWDRVSFSILLRICLLRAKKIVGLRKPGNLEKAKQFKTENLGIYDQVISYETTNFSFTMLSILKYFNIDYQQQRGELYFSNQDLQFAEQYTRDMSNTKIYLNLYGSDASKTLPQHLIEPLFLQLLQLTTSDIVVSCAGNKKNAEYIKDHVIPLAAKRIFLLAAEASIMEESAVIANCDLAVTTNTATMHIAQALKKSLIVLEDKQYKARYCRFPIYGENEKLVFFSEDDFMQKLKQAIIKLEFA